MTKLKNPVFRPTLFPRLLSPGKYQNCSCICGHHLTNITNQMATIGRGGFGFVRACKTKKEGKETLVTKVRIASLNVLDEEPFGSKMLAKSK